MAKKQKKIYKYPVLALGLLPVIGSTNIVAYLLSAPNTFLFYLGGLAAVCLGLYMYEWADAVHRAVVHDMDKLKLRKEAEKEERDEH